MKFTWTSLLVWCTLTTILLLLTENICISDAAVIDNPKRISTAAPVRHAATCEYLDCPSYTVVSRYDDAELRRYDSATWATTHVKHRRYDWAVPIGFHRLLRYFRGDNEDGIKLRMTAPVVVKAALGVAGLKHYIQEYFFLPHKYQMSPPVPSCPDVNITCTSNHTEVFTRSFGGYATGTVVEFLARDFIRNLRDANLTNGNISHFFVAIYDAPFKVIGRYNEIWVPASNRTQVVTTNAGSGDNFRVPPA